MMDDWLAQLPPFDSLCTSGSSRVFQVTESIKDWPSFQRFQCPLPFSKEWQEDMISGLSGQASSSNSSDQDMYAKVPNPHARRAREVHSEQETMPTRDRMFSLFDDLEKDTVHRAQRGFLPVQGIFLARDQNVYRMDDHARDPKHFVQRPQETLSEQEISSSRDQMVSRLNDVLRFEKDRQYFGAPAIMDSFILGYIMEESCSLGCIENVIKKFRATERLVLLELALWKAASMLHPPSSLAYPEQSLVWFTNGWKANKQAMRRHQMMEIVHLVAPFLGMKKKV